MVDRISAPWLSVPDFIAVSFILKAEYFNPWHYQVYVPSSRVELLVELDIESIEN